MIRLLFTLLFVISFDVVASEKMFIFTHKVKDNQDLASIFLEYVRQGAIIDKYSVTTRETISANMGVDLQKLSAGQIISVHVSVKDIDPYRISQIKLEDSKITYGKFDYMISMGTGYRIEEKKYSFLTNGAKFSFNTPLLLNARAFEDIKGILNLYFSLQTNLLRSDIKTPNTTLKSRPEVSISLGYNFIREDDYIPLFVGINKFTEYSLNNSNGVTSVSLRDEITLSAMLGYLYRFSIKRHMGDLFFVFGKDLTGKEKRDYLTEFYFDQEVYKRFGITIKLHYSKSEKDTNMYGGFATLSYFY